MKIAIDKKTIGKIKNFAEFEFIYVFEDETIEELIKTNLHCIHKDYIESVDINLTDFNIDCCKKAKVEEKDWNKLTIPDYKYAIIVPNYNNDHRRV